MNKLISFAGLFAALLMLSAGCSTAPQTQGAKEDLEGEAQLARNRMVREDPSLQPLLDRSAGYAVIPNAGKGGLIIGGAFGRGIVYEKDKGKVGFCSISAGSVGWQAGGQEFIEVLVFESPEAVARFKSGNFELSANASAVALTAGASGQTKFDNGIAIFTLAKAGLMAEASVAGQKFSYEPVDASVNSN